MLLKMNRLLYVLLLSFIWLQIAFVKGSPVSLTVEGGVSLVGAICPDPGTATLCCVGTDLTFLTWSYNGVNDIHSFNTDDLPGTVLLSGPFISVTLNKVTQAANPSFANFTSTLTVNLGELQSVTNIVCGDTRTDSVPVNVTLLQPTAPATPSITSIFANYQSTGLDSIEVTWRKLVAVNCTTFLYYEISVGPGLSQSISQADCTESLCTTQFNTPGVVVTDISLRAINDFGTSRFATYSIAVDSGQYFTPQANIAGNCEATAQCAPGTSLSGSTTCSVRYTSDPTYMNTSDPVTGPLNMTFPVQRLQPNTVYYFVFSVMVDETLTVNVNFQERSDTCNAVEMSESGNIAAAVSVPIFIIICLVVITVIAVIIWTKKNKKKFYSITDERTDSSVRYQKLMSSEKDLLDVHVLTTHLETISEYLHEIWQRSSWLPQGVMTPLDALTKWHTEEGENATYRALVENLTSDGYDEVSKQIRQLVLYASPSAVDKFWNIETRELKVHFMNPDLPVSWNKPDPRTILAWATKGWNKNEKWPRIYEKPCGLEESHIRVKFQDLDHANTWSLVGTDALKDKCKPTMYLCLKECSVEKQKSCVIHEFGHALGLEHEHQRSDVWEVLQKVCDEEGLKEARIKFSPTEESSAGAKRRPYDPDSIMHFWTNSKWLKPEYRDLKNVKKMTDLSLEEMKVIEGVHKRDRTNGKLAEEPSEGDFEALRQVYN